MIRAIRKAIRQKFNPQVEYFGLNELDKKLEPYVDFDNGFYVELGANDGITQSNTLYFEQSRNWRGILIEPAPHNFLECVKRRGHKNHVFCNACVEFDFPNKLVEMTYANLMSISEDLDLDLPDKNQHIENAKAHMKETEVIFSFGAVARPLNAILIEGDAPDRMNLLSLDVEGAELSVLKGIDHDRFRFDYLLVECRSFDRLNSYLSPLGYEFEASLSNHDYLFRDTTADHTV